MDDDDDIEIEHMVILSVHTIFNILMKVHLLHLMNLLNLLLLKTAVAMIERRAIPKMGSFVDIVLS